MILFAWLDATSALAAPAAPRLEWARAFTLAAPEPATMVPGRPAFREGWLLQLRVDPASSAPHQGLAPVLWVGDQPVRRWNFDAVGGCAVVLVEGPVDLARAPVFFGPAELPERLAPADLPVRVSAAVAAGARAFTPAEIAAALEGPALALASSAALDPLAEARVAACGPR